MRLLVLAALLPLVPAAAQPVAELPPEALPSPPPAAADAGADAAHLAAREVQAAMGGAAQAQQIVQGLREAMIGALARPGHAPADVAALVDEVLLPEMKQRVPELLATFQDTLVALFTTEELQALVAFYRSPLGRRLAALQPELAARMAASSRAWGEAVARDAFARHAEELRRLGFGR